MKRVFYTKKQDRKCGLDLSDGRLDPLLMSMQLKFGIS